MYNVIVPKNVLKDIKKLDKHVAKKVPQILEEIGENPYIGVSLEGDLSHIRKWKFHAQGIQFRIAYTIHEDQIEVQIICVGPRENFYEELKRRI